MNVGLHIGFFNISGFRSTQSGLFSSRGSFIHLFQLQLEYFGYKFQCVLLLLLFTGDCKIIYAHST